MVTPDVIWHDDARRRRPDSGRPKLLRAGALLNHRLEQPGGSSGPGALLSHRFEAQGVALKRSGSCPQRIEYVFNIA